MCYTKLYVRYICNCEKEWSLMLALENHLGTIGISEKYLYSLVEHTVSTCYGIAGLDRPYEKSPADFILKKTGLNKGKSVRIDINGRKLNVGIHITVIFGVNIAAVSDSLAHKLCYTIEEKTGLKISRVTIYVDGMVG